MTITKLTPRAILFDMDGVIVDSMPYHFIAWYETLRPLGIQVRCYDIYQREGEKWEISLRDFMRMSGVHLTEQQKKELFRERQNIFKKYFKRYIFPGAEPVIRALTEAGYPVGLVTATTKSEVLRILPAKIRKYFTGMVTGDMVTRGKPYPDPYLMAARQFGLRPSDCVDVENAPYGIRSAKKAGMYCVAVATSLPRAYLRQANCVIDRIEKLLDLVALQEKQ
jgi:beta-phosphoglucomutase